MQVAGSPSRADSVFAFDAPTFIEVCFSMATVLTTLTILPENRDMDETTAMHQGPRIMLPIPGPRPIPMRKLQ